MHDRYCAICRLVDEGNGFVTHTARDKSVWIGFNPNATYNAANITASLRNPGQETAAATDAGHVDPAALKTLLNQVGCEA